jgi:hypothetical protein
VIAVAALVVVLASGSDSDEPSLGGGPPPTGVALRDLGTSIEVSWEIPPGTSTEFIISGGQANTAFNPLGKVGPGKTLYRLNGLNDKVDYCFAVLAVYSVDKFASSPQVCTSRAGN